jgi:hypothetical protein
MQRVSLSLDEAEEIKKYATRDAAYAGRVSLGFALALACLGETHGEDRHVLHEFDVREGLTSNSSTRKSEQIKRLPLYPFWHKQFLTARHLRRNAAPACFPSVNTSSLIPHARTARRVGEPSSKKLRLSGRRARQEA